MLIFVLTALAGWHDRFDRDGIEALHGDSSAQITALAIGPVAEEAASAVCSAAPGCEVQPLAASKAKKTDRELLVASGGPRTWILRSVTEDVVVGALYNGANLQTRVMLQPGEPVLHATGWTEMRDKIDFLRADRDRLQRDAAAPPRQDGPERQREASDLLKAARDAAAARDFDTAKRHLDRLQSEYAGTRANVAARRVRDEVEVIGLQVDTLDVERWFQGEGYTLADHRANLIVFWESWCPHCRREVPKLQSIADRFGDDGLGVVGLTRMTRSSDEATVRAFIDDNDVGYAIGLEDGDMTEMFNVVGIPAAAVVRDGKVVWRGHPARLDDDLVRTLLD